MKILITARHTGIGNQIQFVPVIDYLKDQGHELYSDSEVLVKLNVCQRPTGDDFSRIYVPFGYNYKQVLALAPKYPGVPKFGYKYRIKGLECGMGYAKSYPFDHSRGEVLQNVVNFGGVQQYRPRPPKIHDSLVVHYCKRQDRGLPLDVYKRFILSHPGPVTIVGDPPEDDFLNHTYVKTPEFETLIKVVSAHEYYFGPDTGVMHLADYLNCKCLVLFGATSAVKNGPLNGWAVQSDIHCAPCWDWGRTKCKEFTCLKSFTYEKLQKELSV